MVVTVEAFRAWLVLKDPEEEYDFCSNTNCCFAQFLKESGLATRPYVSTDVWWKTAYASRLGVRSHEIPEEIRLTFQRTTGHSIETFGLALKYLDELLTPYVPALIEEH